MFKIAKLRINSIYGKRLLSTLTAKDAGHYDIIIGGGGLVGTSLLVSLGIKKFILFILFIINFLKFLFSKK